MTEHPMQCYPGQFEPWNPNADVLRNSYIAQDQLIDSYDGAERYGVSSAQIIVNSRRAIKRMMSGQITTGSGKT